MTAPAPKPKRLPLDPRWWEMELPFDHDDHDHDDACRPLDLPMAASETCEGVQWKPIRILP